MSTTDERQQQSPSIIDSEAVVESFPFAFFSIDSEYRIAKTNGKFKRLFPSFINGDLCYKTIFGGQAEVCATCLMKQAVIEKQELSSESVSECNGSHQVFRITASPIFNAQGEITGAMEYIDDITIRAEKEEKIYSYSRHLETVKDETSKNLKRNEHELSLMANSFHEINTAKDVSGLVSEIVNSFIKFRALPVFYAPFDPVSGTMLSLSMHPANYSLERIEGNDDNSIVLTDDNPFLEAAKSRSFMIYHGEAEVEKFIKRTFPDKSPLFYATMRQVLSNCSVLILPLDTETGVEAVTGLAVSPAHLMEHFDTYRHIAKYSAMSLSKQNSAVRLQQAQQMTIMSLVKLVEYRDVETGEHLERIMHYTEILTRELADHRRFRDYITETYINDIVNSCLLHDIGKVGIPDSILKKPGKLTGEEFEIMKKHTLYGGDSLSDAERRVQGRSFLNLSKEIAYCHHEWVNGKGYPYGLQGNNIPLSARIVAVADVYDALRSARPYKTAMSHEEASNLIIQEAGTHFDGDIVESFVRCEDKIRDYGAVQ